MKKIFALFFLAIFLFNTMGYFVVFQLEQYAIKNEMKQNIELGIFDDRVNVITIDNSLLSANDQILDLSDDEFTYMGKKYDILKTETDKCSTTFYAVNDTKEEHLFASLEDHIQRNSVNHKTDKHPLTAKSPIKPVVKILYSEPIISVTSFFVTPILNPHKELIYFSAYKKGVLLPPKLV